MQTLRLTVFAFVLLALSALTAHAQDVAGTTKYFDHDPASAAYVEGYDLCVDAVSDATCQAIGTVRPVATADTVNVTIPSWVPKGKHDLWIRARWKAPLTGSASTNSITRVIVGGPNRLRDTEAVTP